MYLNVAHVHFIGENLMTKTSLLPFISSLLLMAAATATQAHKTDKHLSDTPRWLAGDHHIHSRYSVGWDTSTNPPTPISGGDAIYPIPMNATMARRHGLEWMVSTDHGGPNHAKIHLEHAYPELLESRAAVPEVIQFYGMEFDTPGADHSSLIMPHTHNEADHLHAMESQFNKREPWPKDSARDTEGRMIEALQAMRKLPEPPLVIAHHPSRSATALGEYGMTTPRELRRWNNAAPEIAVGMEGSPGHQAVAQLRERFGPSNHAKYLGDKRPRGAYRGYPTLGGYDQMTATLGGFWDSMLGEGRCWWITANSDSHIHWSDGGMDFWPGEYSKTYVLANKNHASILDGIRSGHIFVTTGDLISELWLDVSAGKSTAGIGDTIKVRPSSELTVSIRFLDPDSRNFNGDNPRVNRVDLIMGQVHEPNDNLENDHNQSTHVVARFDKDQWRQKGPYQTITYTLKDIQTPIYLRVRGTNTPEMEPQPDGNNENPWDDLWFYSNPVFVDL
jgi:hypothetical protein